MYLVHIHLRPLDVGGSLPGDTAATVMSAGSGAGLEHVAVHLRSGAHPVIGVYVRAATLQAAEAVTEDAWWRASATDRSLSAWVPLRVEVPLLPEWPA
ncbi:hypothetical protein [Streptomyces sp. NPDC055189]